MARSDPPPGKTLYAILAFTAGVAFFITLLTIAVLIPQPTSTQFEIFRIVIAVAAACVGAVIPGFITMRLSTAGKFAVHAGGAMALFAIIYFFSPARWVAEPPPQQPSRVETHGPASPNIIGNSGPVNYRANTER